MDHNNDKKYQVELPERNDRVGPPSFRKIYHFRQFFEHFLAFSSISIRFIIVHRLLRNEYEHFVILS